MDGKAKNIDKTFLGSGGGGGGQVEWGTWTPLSLGIFLFPYYKTYFTQICCRVIFRQQIKTFHSKMHVPKKECCIYSTVQKSSTVQKKCMCKKWHKKLLCHKLQATARSESAVFVVYLQELWNERSQKSSPQEATKLPQASRRRTKFLISVNLKEVCGVCRLFVTSFCSLDTNSLCSSM